MAKGAARFTSKPQIQRLILPFLFTVLILALVTGIVRNAESDSVLRFWLFFRGSDTFLELADPSIPTFQRVGTTVVEWGGAVTP